MIELGYLAKRISPRPDWLEVASVNSVWSVSDCISANFCDYVPQWKHNGYWFFDSPSLIREVAEIAGVLLEETTLLYLRSHDLQFDDARMEWSGVQPEPSFQTQVVPPTSVDLKGYDVVSYQMQNTPEHSPLSCNHLASEVQVNEGCLMDSFDSALIVRSNLLRTDYLMTLSQVPIE